MGTTVCLHNEYHSMKLICFHVSLYFWIIVVPFCFYCCASTRGCVVHSTVCVYIWIISLFVQCRIVWERKREREWWLCSHVRTHTRNILRFYYGVIHIFWLMLSHYDMNMASILCTLSFNIRPKACSAFHSSSYFFSLSLLLSHTPSFLPRAERFYLIFR